MRTRMVLSRRTVVIVAVVAAVLVLGLTCYVRTRRHVPGVRQQTPTEVSAQSLTRQANSINDLQDPARAEGIYREIIRNYGSSKEKPVGEQVARARYNLAMNAARIGDYKVAEKMFLEAIDKYHGTSQISPALGVTICERAMFQRAICLRKIGRGPEADSQLVQILVRFPDGGRAGMAEESIRKFHGGRLTPAAQAAVEKHKKVLVTRQHKAALARAMCGPKALEYICRQYHVQATAKQIAKLAKTNETGTSMLSLADAARSLGFQARGLEVNARALRDVSVPSILLAEPAHYIVLTKVRRNGGVVLVDPMRGVSREFSAEQLGRDWKGKVLEISKG